MTFKDFKLKLKTELKDIAKTIRFKKGKRKFEPNGYVHGLDSSQEEFRIKHLAYCMLRGTPYEKIESSHKNDIGRQIEAKCCLKKAQELLQQYRETLEKEDVA